MLLRELFDKSQASPLNWEGNLGVTYASGHVKIGGHDVAIDLGTVPPPKSKPQPRELTPLELKLRQRLGAD